MLWHLKALFLPGFELRSETLSLVLSLVTTVKVELKVGAGTAVAARLGVPCGHAARRHAGARLKEDGLFS